MSGDLDKWVEEIIGETREEAARLKALILEAEWVGTYCGFQVCPWCNGTMEVGAYKFQTGCHDVDCRAFKAKGVIR